MSKSLNSDIGGASASGGSSNSGNSNRKPLAEIGQAMKKKPLAEIGQAMKKKPLAEIGQAMKKPVKMRSTAHDNSNIHPDFGSVASATKKLNNWIGDTVAEGDFSDATSRTRAISDTAAQAIKLGAAKSSNARTLAKKLLANELKNR